MEGWRSVAGYRVVAPVRSDSIRWQVRALSIILRSSGFCAIIFASRPNTSLFTVTVDLFICWRMNF